MFNFNSVVDQVASFTKTTLVAVENKDFRASLETLIDAQTAYAKTIFGTTTELTKQAAEAIRDFDYTKFAVSK